MLCVYVINLVSVLGFFDCSVVGFFLRELLLGFVCFGFINLSMVYSGLLWVGLGCGP